MIIAKYKDKATKIMSESDHKQLHTIFRLNNGEYRGYKWIDYTFMLVIQAYEGKLNAAIIEYMACGETHIEELLYVELTKEEEKDDLPI